MGSNYATGPYHWCDEPDMHVSEVVTEGNWNEEFLNVLLPNEIVDHIIKNISPPNNVEQKGMVFWQLDSKGRILVKTDWQYIRKRRGKINCTS